MSFKFEGFGVGIHQYIPAKENASSILREHFTDTAYAPSVYLFLGRELLRLSACLERLIDENNNPNSTLLRMDNKISAQQTLTFAARGLEDTLKDVKNLIEKAKVRKGLPPKWWATFSRNAKTLKAFAEARENVSFHVWLLEMVFQTLKNLGDFSGTEKRSEALAELFENFIAQDDEDSGSSLQSEFLTAAENACENFPEDFRPESLLRILAFWSFKSTQHFGVVSQINILPEVYLDLLKSAWISRSMREDKRMSEMPFELRCVFCLIENELLLAFKSLSEAKTSLPTRESMLALGDTSIMLLDFDQELDLIPTSSEPTFHGVQASKKLDDKAETSTIAEIKRSMSRSAVHPSAYTSFEAASKNDWRYSNHKRPTVEEEQPPAVPPKIIGEQNGTVRGVYGDVNGRSRNDSVNSFGGRSGVSANTGEEASLRSFGHSGTATPNFDSMQYGVPRLQPQGGNTQTVENTLKKGLSRRKPVPLQPQDPVVAGIDETTPLSPQQSPYRQASASTYSFASIGQNGLSRNDYQVDQGVRPGETEIMPQEFANMSVLVSDTLSQSERWEHCSVRLYRSPSKDLRIVTLRHGSGRDQRFIAINQCELVPQYAFKSQYPVVFIRQTVNSTASPSPSTTSLKDLYSGAAYREWMPATFYYRFPNPADLYNFQEAFLSERVELEIPAVRTVRYRKGLIGGEHSNYETRVQIWKEISSTAKLNGAMNSHRAPSIATTYRKKPDEDNPLKLFTSKLIVYLHEIIMIILITDNVQLELKEPGKVLRLRPSSRKAYGNPSSVRVCFLGSRNITGAFRLDKLGLEEDAIEKWEELKWIEFDFGRPEELHSFEQKFEEGLVDRRRQKKKVDELRRKTEDADANRRQLYV